jgi:hypothetical protein
MSYGTSTWGCGGINSKFMMLKALYFFYNKQALGVEESGQRMLRAEKPSEGLDMGQTMKSNTLNNSITKERMPRPANIRAKVPYRDVFLH